MRRTSLLLAVEFEVAFLAGLKLTDRGREFLRKRHRDQNQAFIRHRCCAQDVFGRSPHEGLGRRSGKLVRSGFRSNLVPGRGSMEAGFRIALQQRESESPLQGRLMLFEQIGDVRKVVSGEGAHGRGRTCDGGRFRRRILLRVGSEQRRHRTRILSNFLHRTREPPVDRAVHQSVGEPEHHDDGKKREQQAGNHQARAKFGPEYAQPALGEKLEQVASENEGERDEKKKDECRERGKQKKLLVAVRVQKRRLVKGRLGKQNSEQQGNPDGERNDDALAIALRIGGWRRFGHGRKLSRCAPRAIRGAPECNYSC